MKLHQRILASLLAAVLLASLPEVVQAKGYSSSGGHSYSSHSSSSHSSGSSGSRSSGSSGSSRSSSGSPTRSSGSKTFNSGSGKGYSSGSTSSDSNRKSYNSAKSYSSSDGKRFSSTPRKEGAPSAPNSSGSSKNNSGEFAFDTAAARARKQETSKEQFSQYKQSQNPAPATSDAGRSAAGADSYRGQPPPIVTPGGRPSRPGLYIPDHTTISTRPVRIYNVYHSYGWRPWVSYRDPYGSLFWWWLLDRSLDDRAWWAYHHRYDMDPARYEALVATDAQLQARVAQLEAQQVARDQGYVPPGLDGRDLMYSDHYVNRAYSNRPTTFGVISFWVFGIPLALGFCAFFIWLIWFKRWQTST